MLLLVTNRDDITADWLVLELRRRGEEFVRFNTEDYPTRACLYWTTDGGRLTTDSYEIRADAVRGVWWRRALPPVLGAGRSEEEAGWAVSRPGSRGVRVRWFPG